MSRATRTGILGGTFDPIHHGHLDAARAAQEALQLNEVLLVPARVSPHRTASPRASAYHRFAMVALATAGRDALVACDLELRGADPSYTSVTLEQMALAGYVPAQLFFITGADAFAEIATWHDYPAVLDRSHFIVVSRPGYPVSSLRARLPDLASRMQDVRAGTRSGGQTEPGSMPPSILLVDALTSAASSSEVRRRLSAGEPLAGLTPPDVETYIRRHRLYSPDALAADNLHGQS